MDKVPHTTESVLRRWGLWQDAANLSPKTVYERANCIRHLLAFAQCGPLDLTPDDIIAYCTRQGLSRATKATYHASIRAYCAWLVRTKQRPDDPTTDTPTPKRPKGIPRPVAEHQLVLMLAAANRRRTRMMILMAALAGLRIHEIAKFDGSDLDRDRNVLYVRGKGDKDAMLPIHPVLMDASELFPDSGLWFPSYTRPGPVHPASVGKAISSAMKRSGVTATPHQLRHFYGTKMLDNGANLRVVQELMRHESIATTQIYTLVDLDQMRRAVGTLNVESPAS